MPRVLGFRGFSALGLLDGEVGDIDKAATGGSRHA